MAEGAIGGAVLGYAVNKLLDEVLTNFRYLKDKTGNVLKLHNLLERLESPAKQLCSSIQQGTHPADKWLTELRQLLEKCRRFVQDSGKVSRNILKSIRTSKESLKLYENVYILLWEASVQQWAAGLSIQSTLTENEAKILEELSAAQERDEQLLRRIADLASKVDIRSAISELSLEQDSSSETLDGSSSSAVQTERPCTSSTSDDAFPRSRILDRSSTSTISAETFLTDSTYDIPEPQVTFGGEAVADDLINHLLSGDCKKWIALYGMGGIGKSFTASVVYHDSRIRQHFSGGMIWLTVSKDQPGTHHLLKQLLYKIEGRGAVSQLPKTLGAAKSSLKSKLDKERVLLVLDDVWQNDVLEYLDVIPESKGGVILVTTRDQGILRRVITSVKIFEIPRLSSEDSWQLFSYHAFRDPGRVLSPDVIGVAKEVAEECGGLPLALEVIGSIMATDKELIPAERALGQTTLRVWEVALEQLRSANHGNDEYEALYLKLQVSVDSLLEQDFRLQDCFFYFTAFEEDLMIDTETLVGMWIAEGLVHDSGDSSFSAEEEGRVLLGFLVAKSMVKVTYGGSFCYIHDVLRDVALRNLNWDSSTGKQIQASVRKCLYAPGLHKSEVPEEWITSAPSSAKRLSLRGNDLRQFPEPEQFHAPHLQVLILSRNESLRSLSPRFFQNLSNLKVLDLSDTDIETIPGVLLRRLQSLVLLDLRRCSKLQKVSDEVDKLQSLEFLLLPLDLHDTSLRKLPLVNNLTKLKTYCATVPQEEAEMGRLGGCGIWSRRGTHRRGIQYQFPPKLRKLNLFFNSTAKYALDASSLYSLEELRLQSVGRAWNKKHPSLKHSTQSIVKRTVEFHRLKVLSLQVYYGTQVPDLGSLPLLEDLEVTFWSHIGTESYGHKGAFASLKKLRMYCEQDMEKMFVFHPGTMPKIESLYIKMQKSEHYSPSITELRSLKSLQLYTKSPHIYIPKVLRSTFEQLDCFPHLEFLRLPSAFFSFENYEPILPEHILEREVQGKLVIGYGIN